MLWLKAEKVQHLHAHFCTNSAEVAMQCRQLGGPPYSFTAHGSDLMDKPTLMGLDLKTTRAKFAVAVCSYGRSQLFRWIPHSEWHKIKVIRCGLEPEYSGVKVDRLSGPKRIVCVGRLSKEKGQLLLLKAINLLNVNRKSIHLTIVGDGPMKQEIFSLCELYGLNDLVEFTGWQSAEAVRQHMLKADAIVLPSLSEGLPIVIMEAMALKTAVIAPYLAGIPELVVQNETGWLYPAGDFVALAHAIELLITTSDEHLSQMGKNAFDRVWKDHNAENSSRQLCECIHEGVKELK
jgi:glycosyltransferase involved in cell wall biosynthesis